MLSLPTMILPLLANFAHVFTKPTWNYVKILLIGTILSSGKRTVTSALQAMRLSKEKNFSKYHRILNGAKWDRGQLSKILLGLLLPLIPTNCPILIAMDETIERRKGKEITAKGCYRDACRSSKSLIIYCFGLKWQCASMLIKLPWSNRYWALPFMTALCVAKSYDDKKNGYSIILMKKKKSKLNKSSLGYLKKKLYYLNATNTNIELTDKLNDKLIKGIKSKMTIEKKFTIIRRNIQKLGKKDMKLLTTSCGIKRINHRSSVDYALLMMIKINQYLNRDWIFLGDGGFSCVKLGLACQRRKVTLISRLRKDSALYEPVSEITTKQRGRPKQKGERAKSLNEIIQQPDLVWEEYEIDWYGGKRKRIALHSGINLWYKSGNQPLAIRWVLVKDLDSGKIESFFSTDQNLSAIKIIEYFILRWNLETTFEEVRAHLGVETQRQWSDNAINTTTPILMGIFSLVCLMADKLTKNGQIPVSITAWYNKNNQATFSDVLRFVKQTIIREKYINTSWKSDDIVQIPIQELENLINNGFMAA